MSIKEALVALNYDKDSLETSVNVVYDRIGSDEKELHYMLNGLWEEYPALNGLIKFLMKRHEITENLTVAEHNAMIYGATVLALTLRDYAETKDLDEHFYSEVKALN